MQMVTYNTDHNYSVIGTRPVTLKCNFIHYFSQVTKNTKNLSDNNPMSTPWAEKKKRNEIPRFTFPAVTQII